MMCLQSRPACPRVPHGLSFAAICRLTAAWHGAEARSYRKRGHPMRRLLLKAVIGFLAGAISGLVVAVLFPDVGGVPLKRVIPAVGLAGLVAAISTELLERVLRP